MKPYAWPVAAMIIALAAGCATTPARRVAIPAEPTLPEVRAIASYSFGDSRVPLTVVEDMVRRALPHDENRAILAADLAALLQTDATRDAKLFACRQLAIIGGEQHVPAIAPLLYDSQTADMARYALEPIPGRAVDNALIDALGAVPDDIKVGIINSLGNRQSVHAAAPLRILVNDLNPAVAAAAQDALQNIDT